MDANDALERLEMLLAEFRDERDWAQYHTLKDLAAISIEAGELQQHFLWKSTDTETELLETNREGAYDSHAPVNR